MIKLIVLYPHPSDKDKFEKDYETHLSLLHEKMRIPENVKPYKVIKMMPMPTGLPHFYQMFSMSFDSPEELQTAMSSQGMQEVGIDAQRISTGGLPIMLVGNED